MYKRAELGLRSTNTNTMSMPMPIIGTFNSNTNTNTKTNTNTNSSNVGKASSIILLPSVQNLMVLLQEQSKVINGLQMTIESLSVTIKNLNDKVQRLEVPERVGVLEHVLWGMVDNVANVTNVANVASVNVTTGSKNDHSKSVHITPVHEKTKTLKCQESSRDASKRSEINNVHENSRDTRCLDESIILFRNTKWSHWYTKLFHCYK